MPIFSYENLKDSDFTNLDRTRSCILLPVGPLEAQEGLDSLEAKPKTATVFCKELANRFQQTHQDWNFILFPTIFAGTSTKDNLRMIELSPPVLRGLIYHCCKQLSKAGFKNIIAIGTHGGPRQSVVLDEVSSKMRWRHRMRMVSAQATDEALPWLQQFVDGKEVQHQLRSKYYLNPYLRTDFKWIVILTVYALVLLVAFLMLNHYFSVVQSP